MADQFNISIMDILNTILREKCPYLSLFYRSKRRKSGGYKRRIGFYYNKTVGGVVYKNVEVSHIELDETDATEMKIEMTSTLEESEHNIKFKERKLNLCLLYLAGMIAAKEGVRLRAFATSPITLYTMKKYFDCTIKKGAEVNDDTTADCSTLASCKIYMEQDEVAPGETDDYTGDAISVSILTSIPDYDDMFKKIEQLITDLNCVGLGGTRRKRKKNRTKRT